MVLVPLRGSGTRGDQVENARLFQEAGAAVCFMPEENPSAEALSRLIASLASDPEKRMAMGEAGISGKDAAGLIAKEIMDKVRRENE
jgi:UDP-N-acetylglucosamine--N-acetylmuramyl-(pentapeptide) pyrophosphoryl-undecaprenol N-acetylglucosamine transferase